MGSRRLRRLSAWVAALWLAGAGPAFSGSPPDRDKPLEKVLVGELPILPSVGNFIALEKGWFRELGLDVELRMFRIGTRVLPLLAKGMLDVGGGGVTAGLYNAVAAGGGIRIVADKGHHPPGDTDRPVHAIVVSKKLFPGRLDAGVIRGKRFAVSGRGNPQEIYLDLFLNEYGLSLDDVEVLTMPLPSMIAALAEGSLFGAALLEPFLTLSQKKGIGVPVMAGRELYPGQQGGVLIYSGDFMEKRREAAVRFMAGYLRGVRYFNDYLEGKVDGDEIFDIVKKHTSLDDRELFERIGKPSISPDGRLNTAGMEKDMGWLRERGYLEGVPDMSLIVDLSFIEEAVSRLEK